MFHTISSVIYATLLFKHNAQIFRNVTNTMCNIITLAKVTRTHFIYYNLCPPPPLHWNYICFCLFVCTRWGLPVAQPLIYLFGVLCHFQHCSGHITMGSFVGRGNQYIQLVKVLYCKLSTTGKQLPTFPT